MPKQSFFCRSDGNLQRIILEEILFLESAGNYVKFYALNYSHLVRTSLDAALNQLPENYFVQIHRSYAVAVDHLDTISKESVTFVSVPGFELPVSKKYYAALQERITIIESASSAG
jgi:two-component system LytT family response regulator